jgi:hypothetical protein
VGVHREADEGHDVSDVEVRIDGDEALRLHLERVNIGLRDLDAFDAIAGRMASLARAFAPHRTGRLAGSIRAETTRNRASIVATAPYAAIINYGSAYRNIEAQHYMQRVDPPATGYAVTQVELAIARLIN